MDNSKPTKTKVNKSEKTQKPDSTLKQTNRRHIQRTVGVLGTCLIAILAGFGGAWAYDYTQTHDTALPSLQPNIDGNNLVNKDGSDVVSVAKKVSPSVVSIVAGNGAGTGIIISSDGYILTNDHVVKSARDFSIVTESGQRYKNVKFVGFDPLNDIAFLKIEGAKDLPVAQLGDSGTIRIGQQVIAVGNALGQYSNSVTNGIVSGLGRPLIAQDQTGRNTEQLSDLIQTDAAINSGNSGGPLVNMSGQVIGVNVAMAQGANTIGFAIPINAAKGVIAGVLETGKVQRSYIGVRYVDITPEIIARYDLPVKHGAYVRIDGNASPVEKNSPADKAGIKNGDIITKVNDQKVGERGELVSLIGQYKPGDRVNLTVLRDSKTVELTIVLGAYATDDK